MREVFRGSTSSNHQMYTIETSNSDDIREAVFSIGGTSRRRTVVSREEHAHQEKSISSSRIPIVAKMRVSLNESTFSSSDHGAMAKLPDCR